MFYWQHRPEDFSWWLNVPTIKIAEKLAYHINETKDPIRYGPVQILLEKAENIDHFLIALQVIRSTISNVAEIIKHRYY